jgi:hypothetical protein
VKTTLEEAARKIEAILWLRACSVALDAISGAKPRPGVPPADSEEVR